MDSSLNSYVQCYKFCGQNSTRYADFFFFFELRRLRRFMCGFLLFTQLEQISCFLHSFPCPFHLCPLSSLYLPAVPGIWHIYMDTHMRVHTGVQICEQAQLALLQCTYITTYTCKGKCFSSLWNKLQSLEHSSVFQLACTGVCSYKHVLLQLPEPQCNKGIWAFKDMIIIHQNGIHIFRHKCSQFSIITVIKDDLLQY